LAVAQNPDSAEVDFMPRAAIEATQVDHIMEIEDIAGFLAECCFSDESLGTSAVSVKRE
jgi:chemotaxis response regulator CheB